METIRIKLKDIAPNKGQIPGLPANPRQWSRTEIDKIAKSLKETPELFEARPIIVMQYAGKFVILGGNLRYEGCKANKDVDAPCFVVPDDTPVEKLKEIIIKDNGSFGQWDYDALANEWDDLPLVDWGVPAWSAEGAGEMNLTTEGREGEEGYDEFVDKFKQKLTTDDCYTPTEVYDTLLVWIDEKIRPIDRKAIVRPFFPGGDYKNHYYPEGCVVIDNPPFSIFSEIVRFYAERKIPFFLFGPSLTLFGPGVIDGVCYIVSNASVVYENGAVVSTGFVTNLIQNGDLIWVNGDLRERIAEAQKEDERELGRYDLPDNVLSSARIGKICKNPKSDLRIKATEAIKIKQLDGFKELGKGLYGGGFILSRAAAERAAAERAAIKIELSARELAIVAELDKLTAQGEKTP